MTIREKLYQIFGENVDSFDLKILRLLQQDASISVDMMAEAVGLSRNACWRRVKLLEQGGAIVSRRALLDPEKMGCNLMAIVLIRTSGHDAAWRERFQRVVSSLPQVVGAYRMTGDLDYVLRVRIADMVAYDRFYKQLTSQVQITDISASFVMEFLKETTEIPF